ncbi:hypothetical protein LB579_25430 [Mesorhizobium sp. BR1-1-7]|nr:hypothetical protein [Mesorhizobium sp. BR1-1-7]
MSSGIKNGQLSFVEFQSPTLVENAPEGSEWLHEIKYDGYRTELIIESGKARAFTRRGYDWSHRYRRIVQAAAGLPVKAATSMARLSFLATPACRIPSLGTGAGQSKLGEAHLLCLRPAAPQRARSSAAAAGEAKGSP